jgi:hypothetical protein
LAVEVCLDTLKRERVSQFLGRLVHVIAMVVVALQAGVVAILLNELSVAWRYDVIVYF